MVATALKRLRTNVATVDDLGLLVRVAVVMGAMPLLLRLPLPRLLAWLEAASARLAVEDAHRIGRVITYCGRLGRLHVWSFQDNCVARSLTLFTLLNSPSAPLDVVFGVRTMSSSDGAVVPGRRHVWLEKDNHPFLETEPVHEYAVSMRYRDRYAARQRQKPSALASRSRLWSSTVLGGAASGVVALAGFGRVTAIAVMLGPLALGLAGQQTTLAVLLSGLATFGMAGGTTRFLSEATAAGDATRAALVLRSSAIVQGASCVAIAAVLFAMSTQGASMVFGRPGQDQWLLWLMSAVPLTALTSFGLSVLRADRAYGRQAAAQVIAALASLAAIVLLASRGEPGVVKVFPATVAAFNAVAVSMAAWPAIRRRWIPTPTVFDWTLARRLMEYGAVNVAIAACSALVVLFVGRTLLSLGDGTHAGIFYAVSLGADALLSLVLGGYHAYYYPAFCATTGAADASRLMGRITRTFVFFGVPLIGVAALLAPIVVPIAGESFHAAIPLAGPVALAVYLRGLGAIFGIPLLARGRLIVVTGFHTAWSVGLALLFLWFGAATPGNWASAFALVSALHVVVLAAVLPRLTGTTIGTGTLILAAVGAATLFWIAR